MTEQEIKSKRDEIHNLKGQIQELNGKITEIECELRGHFLSEAEKKHGIQRGDKVIVTHRYWTYQGYVTEQSEPLFFAYARYNRFTYEIGENGIEFVFRQPKKNGQPSQKETCFLECSVTGVEKVTE